MREKLLWSAVIILGGALVTSKAQAPAPSASGRYQIINFAGTGVKGGPVFRLDTQTGQTSELALIRTSEGNDVLAWKPVQENSTVKPAIDQDLLRRIEEERARRKAAKK